jgi:hypothetical protein
VEGCLARVGGEPGTRLLHGGAVGNAVELHISCEGGNRRVDVKSGKTKPLFYPTLKACPT